MGTKPTNIKSLKRPHSFSNSNPMNVDPRFLKTSGFEVFSGNELLVKGALEAGISLITGYPGSPVSDVFETCATVAPYLAEHGVMAQIANNEALAGARLNGAVQGGMRAIAVMKSVGFHVAADSLAVGNLMETRKPDSGALIVVGDDPWNETTQINSDSRYLSKHLHMPVVEPTTFQELKDWMDICLEISGATDLYVTYIITTNLADGGGTVRVKPHKNPPVNTRHPAFIESSKISISDHVMIPPHTSMREATLAERHNRFIQMTRERELNKWFGPTEGPFPMGFVTAGLSFGYLEEVLQLLGLWGKVPVLKLGATYPLDEEPIKQMANMVDHLFVVEEKRGFLEEQISALTVKFKQAGQLPKPPALWGKNFPDGPGFPSNRGLNVSVILETLAPLIIKWSDQFSFLPKERVERELAEIVNTRAMSFDVPLRTPTFCPGCPHRDSATAHIAIRNENPESEIIFHGESGCHSMLQFPPNQGLMQNYSGMGLGGGTGAGMSPFVGNSQVVFLGDGTFFHSGILAISDSIKNNQNITYVILENKTTAMTGHQPTPGNEWDIMGYPTRIQNIEDAIRGLSGGTIPISRVNPSERESYESLLKRTIPKPGLKVIIADKECAITFNRRKNKNKKKILAQNGFIPIEEKMNIATDVCEFCLECSKTTGCPGLTIEETVLGPKMATDLSTCVDDGACSRGKVCPSFEKVTISRRKPVVAAKQSPFDLTDLPQPRRKGFEKRWAAYTAGVGGMGAGVVNSILVRAGLKEGFEVSFLDKKGLAIRNGGVYGHVVYSKIGPVQCPVIPYGKADLLIGLDLIEAARAIDARMNLRVAHPGRTHSVLNIHKNHTVLSLTGNQEIDVPKLKNAIKSRSCFGGFFADDFGDLAERELGSKLYANLVLLGAAYQHGWLPVSSESIESAIKETIRESDWDLNLRAFLIGRFMVAHPDKKADWSNTPLRLNEFIDKKKAYLIRESKFHGKKDAAVFQELIEQVERWMDLPSESKKIVAQAVYDLIRYGGPKMAHAYISELWSVYKKDQKRYGFKATETVAANLYKVMAIKDEVWVAKLLTSPEKYDRDRARYKIDPSRGDRINYVHFNRPQFVVAGRKIEFDIQTKDWMLRLMKHAGFLRKMLPAWHAEEKEFRDWYIHVIRQFNFFDDPEDYTDFVEALKVPDRVKGYRSIRSPQMNLAMKAASGHLLKISLRQESSSKPGAPSLPV